MVPSSRWPRLHLEEASATAADLHSYLRGFIALKGREGNFPAGTSGVSVTLEQHGSYRVVVYERNYFHVQRMFEVSEGIISVLDTEEITFPKDTEGFHAWFITSLLAAHLKSCFQEREAAAS